MDMHGLYQLYTKSPCLSNAVRLCPFIDVEDISERFAHLQVAGEITWPDHHQMFVDLLEHSPPFREMCSQVLDVFMENLFKVLPKGRWKN